MEEAPKVKQGEFSRRQFMSSSALALSFTAISRGPVAAFGSCLDRLPLASEQLPSMPQEKPLNWRARADEFDQYVMNPANGVLKKRADGSLYFASALEGTGDGGLTTFAPLVLGKILRGDDADHLLSSMSAYFSDEAGIFLDGTHADLCEYWYLMNVNALVDGIIRCRLLHDPIWIQRVRKSADRLIELSHQVSYNFNDQGYRFNTRLPFTNKDIYRQPDTIGGYAYVLLFAHELLGDDKYLKEAQKALNLYQAFSEDPWYEIPSGAMACLAAARLSINDRNVDFRKILAFALRSGGQPMQTGQWGGREVNGLMAGFRTEPAGQAYSMESLMTLPYLLPALRYRPEYATEIGRYLLNAAANMRLFYSDCLPRQNQSRPDLTCAVPYERLTNEVDGHSPYASGDYDSHRSIYGGAYALLWGELVKPTEDEYILQMNLSRTDFLCTGSFPTYMYYNPRKQSKQVTFSFEAGTFDVYDLQTQKFIAERQSKSMLLSLPAESSRIVVIVPSGAKRRFDEKTLSCDGVIVDYGQRA